MTQFKDPLADRTAVWQSEYCTSGLKSVWFTVAHPSHDNQGVE